MKRLFLLIVCVGTAALFAAGVHWVWQMGCLARESAETARVARVQLEAIGAEVTGALADVKALTARLQAWGGEMGVAEVSRSMAAGMASEEKPRNAAADAQIEELLARIRDADITWDSAEGDKPRLLLFGIVAAKYGMLKRGVVTPEEFIAKVTFTDLFGKPLRIKRADGVTVPLPDWLRGELAKIGNQGVNGSPSPDLPATVAP